MSDYGFKTDDKNRATVLNAKNPIFGFDLQHTPRAFKTFHIIDTKTSPIHTGSVATPNPQPAQYSWDWSENIDYGKVRELITRVKHGYSFRPVGYATITGTLKYGFNVSFTQTQRAGSYGGNYSKNLTKVNQPNEYILTPNISGLPTTNITGYGSLQASTTLSTQDFSGTTWPAQYPKDIMTYYSFGPLRHAPESFWPNNGMPRCIEVVIDDEYIYFYRTYIWSDSIRRVKYNSGGTIIDDIQERVKVSEQFIGSEYNVTVYLCPFPIEELLTSTNTPVSPTNIGVWDESLWDSGKEWG